MLNHLHLLFRSSVHMSPPVCAFVPTSSFFAFAKHSSFLLFAHCTFYLCKTHHIYPTTVYSAHTSCSSGLLFGPYFFHFSSMLFLLFKSRPQPFFLFTYVFLYLLSFLFFSGFLCALFLLSFLLTCLLLHHSSFCAGLLSGPSLLSFFQLWTPSSSAGSVMILIMDL